MESAECCADDERFVLSHGDCVIALHALHAVIKCIAWMVTHIFHEARRIRNNTIH